LIFLLLIVLAFFEFETFRVSSGRSLVYCAKLRCLLRAKMRATEHNTGMTSFDRAAALVLTSNHGAIQQKIRPPISHQRAETCLTFRVLV
jgi:hypothetical protein